MANKDLKKELVSYIENTNDEAFLTDTLDEFKKATQQWRTRRL
ncbi:MAG: hypothetical protein ACTHLE_05915 [Agriterribacter sp.]